MFTPKLIHQSESRLISENKTTNDGLRTARREASQRLTGWMTHTHTERGGFPVDSTMSRPGVPVTPALPPPPPREPQLSSNSTAVQSSGVCCSHDCPAETANQRTAELETADRMISHRLLCPLAAG